MELWPWTPWISVEADGFASIDHVLAAADHGGIVDILLRRLSNLTLIVRDARGNGCDSFNASLSPVARSLDITGDLTAKAVDRGRFSGAFCRAIEFPPLDETGQATLEVGDTSGPLEILVTDETGCHKFKRTVVMAEGVDQTVIINTDVIRRSLDVRVVTADGLAVAGAEVSLLANAEPSELRRTRPGADVADVDMFFANVMMCECTDSNGQAAFSNIPMGAATVMIVAEGYARSRRRIEIPESGGRATFVLQPENIVTLVIEDESGRRIEPESVYRTVAGLPIHGALTAAGDFEFTELDAETVHFVAEILGIRYELDHDSRRPVAKLVVPMHGRVKARFSTSGVELNAELRLRLDGPAAGGTPRYVEFLRPSAITQAQVDLPQVPIGPWRLTLEYEDSKTKTWIAAGSPRDFVVQANTETLIDL